MEWLSGNDWREVQKSRGNRLLNDALEYSLPEHLKSEQTAVLGWASLTFEDFSGGITSCPFRSSS